MDWAAALAALKAIWPAIREAIIALVAAMTQKKLDEGHNAKETLSALKRADEAVGTSRSAADVLRDLQRRRRVRDL